MSDADREGKKEYMKSYYYKINLLNHLIKNQKIIVIINKFLIIIKLLLNFLKYKTKSKYIKSLFWIFVKYKKSKKKSHKKTQIW